MNAIYNGTTNQLAFTNAGVVLWIQPGGTVTTVAPIIYAGVTYPSVGETTCKVLVGENGVVEGLDNIASVPFGQGLYMGMVAAFAAAVAIMFLRGAKGFFRSGIGSDT